MARVGAKHVKSAKRVLEVFEFFQDVRRPVSVMDIARCYGYPQSSTSELLSCLVELGFLQRERGRTFRPTAKVAMLGAWVHPSLFRGGVVLPMMDRLAASSGRPIMLASALGFTAQCLDVSKPPESEFTAPDWSRFGSLFHSTAGMVLLSSYDRQLVQRMLHRLNAESATEWRLDANSVLERIGRIREQGYALECGKADDGRLVAAVLLPPADMAERFALSIILEPGDEETAVSYVQALRNAVATHIGPRLVHRADSYDKAVSTSN